MSKMVWFNSDEMWKALHIWLYLAKYGIFLLKRISTGKYNPGSNICPIEHYVFKYLYYLFGKTTV
jgi:hypothetical protein